MALHSDYEVKWQNFKGFKDTGWIKIKPITIILGTNNSGKTSFISPLLLMNQTIVSRDPKAPLITRGETIDSGAIKNIFPEYDLKKKVTFGFRYHIHKEDENTEKIGSYPPGAIEFTLGA